MPSSVTILTPVFNDWECLQALLKDFATCRDLLQANRLHFLVVDDCSETVAPSDLQKDVPEGATLEILPLLANGGHQRAIAIGLSYIEDKVPCDFVVVMDSDGEDNPHVVHELVQRAAKEGSIVVAQRQKRSEGPLFKFCYGIYKEAFKFLTQHVVDFGNFCVLPKSQLRRLVIRPHLWCNFPATIIRSRLRFGRMPTDRTERYAGESKMNFVRLVLHGLSAMAVFTDIVLVRMLMLGLGMAGVAGLSLLGIFLLQLFTDLAIAGWAPSAFAVFGLLLGIVIWSSMTIVLSHLDAQIRLPFIPIQHYEQFLVQESDAAGE